ncbi:glycosyltransferase [Oceanobacillus picturae]|uniref:glycosyltransferase n=1 Tax=Oceanobacillus picturae TaxID=171693 RepID=UPI000E6A2F7E|nr:glycosyltransferase [Oceanobacillus picturae]RIU94913.1 glycosyltransferase [Oceanobacillus picturae]
MKQKIFMLTWDIDVNKGGITQVMLKRSAMLSDKYDVTLLTLDFKRNYSEIKKELSEMGRLHKKVNIVNIHDYYKSQLGKNKVTNAQLKNYKKQCLQNEKGFQIKDDYISNKKIDYYKDGVLVKTKKWDKEGSLFYIDYFENNKRRAIREAFLSNGHMYKKTYYDSELGVPNQISFYTLEGNCFLTKELNPKNNKITKVILFNQDESIQEFKNNDEFKVFWLTELCMREKTKPIIICDGPGSTNVMLQVKSTLAYKIATIHTNHFSEPHVFGSKIKKNHVGLLDNIDKEDALVVLTETQKNHIEKQYGKKDHIHVIPHHVKSTKKVPVAKKDPKLVSMVARYHPEKRIDLAIMAFKQVINEVPDARLEIHGEGPDRKRLEKIIKENNLKDNVFLKGYVNDFEKAFTKPLISLLTSKYEGFSLVILESMACKTPVISFDILYGPRDIISDKKTGMLIEESNIEQLADNILFLLKNPSTAIKMGEKARKSVRQNYSIKKQKKAWIDVFEGLTSK